MNKMYFTSTVSERFTKIVLLVVVLDRPGAIPPSMIPTPIPIPAHLFDSDSDSDSSHLGYDSDSNTIFMNDSDSDSIPTLALPIF